MTTGRTMRDRRTDPPEGRLSRAVRWLFGGPLLSPIASIAASAIIPVGPWLVSVLALSVISLTLTPVLGRGAIEDIRLAVVYAFAISLIATAPVAALAARLASRAAEEQEGRLLADLYVVCLTLAGLFSQFLALVVVFGFGIAGIKLAVAFVVLTATASLLWTSFAMLSALRRYWQVVGAFLIGTLIALGCALLSTIGTPSVEILLWSFALGLSISHHLMFSSTVGGARVTWPGLAEAAAAIWREISRNGALFFGVMFAMAGVWADKSVFWFGPDGMVARSGLFHFAPYDSAMFIAHLSMIPTLAAWYLFQQTVLEPRVQRFWRLIEARPTYQALASEAAGLQDLVWRSVFRILFFQGACSAVMIMLAPQIIRALAMQSDQIELLQIGSVAVLLQSLFFLSSAIIMVCNRSLTFFRLNLAFFILSVTLGILCYLIFGVAAYAVFLASLLCAAASFVFAYQALGDFVFTIFVKENDGLYAEKPVLAPGVLLRRAISVLVGRIARRSKGSTPERA